MKKAMKIILSIFAYLWAVICIFVVFTIFLGSDTLTNLSLRLPFMKLDPVYSGGAVVKTYPADSVLIEVHEPVFSALIGESKNGFIQIKFRPDTTGGRTAATLPETITEKIDYNSDGVNDFILDVNTLTGETGLKVCPSKHMSVKQSSSVHDYWVVRVGLPNPRFTSACSTCAGCPSNQK